MLCVLLDVDVIPVAPKRGLTAFVDEVVSLAYDEEKGLLRVRALVRSSQPSERGVEGPSSGGVVQ